jgi:hypothetical protein
MYVCVCSGITIFPWMAYFHFPLLPDCISTRKSISRQKCGILPKGPKYLRKYVCTWLISAETNNEELLIGRQRFVTTDILTATIDLGGYKRKATDSFKRVHEESPRYTRATPGNQIVDKHATAVSELRIHIQIYTHGNSSTTTMSRVSYAVGAQGK